MIYQYWSEKTSGKILMVAISKYGTIAMHTDFLEEGQITVSFLESGNITHFPFKETLDPEKYTPVEAPYPGDILWANLLEEFLKSPDFKEGVIASTKVGWGGSHCLLELFPDRTWKRLWSESVGNLYNSPGVMLRLPEFSEMQAGEDERSWDEFFNDAFANEEVSLAEEMRKQLGDEY